MKNKKLLESGTLLGILCILALTLISCGPAATAAPAISVPPTSLPATEVPTEAVATEAPIEVVTEAPVEVVTEAPIEVVTEAPVEVATDATVAEAPAGPATVQFDGIILTNGEGMSLYVCTGGGIGGCTGGDNEWPPLLTNGNPIPGNGVDASELSTFTLDDGTTQVLYNGMGLHLFHGDTVPGDINGDGREEWGGTWSLVICNGLVC